MTYISNLTRKGQVTIPVDIRNFLNLSFPQEVAFIKRNKEVIVKPAVDFLSLKGTIKPKKRYSDKKADEAIGKFIAKNYKKTK